MATLKGEEKDAAAVKVFPPAIPLLTILGGVLLDNVLPIDFAPNIPSPLRYWIGGGIIATAILGLGAWSVIIMRKDGQSENPWKPTFKVLDRGPFRISRNPMYLQMVIVCIGAGIVLMNWWVLLMAPVCGWLLQRLAIIPEEAYLESKFGDAYLAYKARVRRWL